MKITLGRKIKRDYNERGEIVLRELTHLRGICSWRSFRWESRRREDCPAGRAGRRRPPRAARAGRRLTWSLGPALSGRSPGRRRRTHAAAATDEDTDDSDGGDSSVMSDSQWNSPNLKTGFFRFWTECWTKPTEPPPNALESYSSKTWQSLTSNVKTTAAKEMSFRILMNSKY